MTPVSATGGLTSALGSPGREEEKPACILIVDDEPYLLSATRRILRGMPWRVLTAGSGAEALEILGRERVQVVISDYRMPGMDGVTFLCLVKERWPDTQRVMLTGQADVQAVERAINEGEVQRFQNKPWHPPQMIATIEECLEKTRLLDENRRYERELAERNRDLEHQVQERSRALIQAEKMAALGRMAGGVAHEINNPLGGILAFAQVLLRDSGKFDPDTVEGLEMIQSCALRCKDIVERLLSFSRRPLMQDHLELDLNRVAEAGLALIRLDGRAKMREVGLELATELPRVRGQANLLEQLVLNLLLNALQATAAGQKVILRTGCTDGGPFLEVEDNGCGIPENELAHVFEPFFTTKPVGEGTGLGLSICFGIAEEHGGRLSVKSQAGHGANFRLQLPAAIAGPAKESPG